MSKSILVVCNDETRYSMISLGLKGLKYKVDVYPELAWFATNTRASRKKFTDDAEAMLEKKKRDTDLPTLIIIDALARRAENVLKVIEGQAARNLLEWLQEFCPTVPVLVVAAAPTQDVERLVVGRPNTALWRMNHSDSGGRRDVFAETLAGIAPAQALAEKRRETHHITIDVRRNSACYRLSNGRYEFLSSNPIAYGQNATIDRFMDRIERLTPWRDGSNTPPDKLWSKTAVELGGALYEMLMRYTVGSHVQHLLAHPSIAADGVPPEIDVRFEIDSDDNDYNDLFKLPFELLNDSTGDGVMCSRVPMARRVRINRSGDWAEAPLATTREALRVLFMHADVKGHVALRKLDSEETEPARTFAELPTIGKEFELLQKLAKAHPGQMAEPELIGHPDKKLFGKALCEALRTELKSRKYDLFHFCGHSATLADGQTYLIFPDDAEGYGFGVPIGLVAEWLRDSDTRMVVLSSCEGASARTARETMRVGIERLIGFRWKVEADLCEQYFQCFYEKYLVDQNLCEAYRFACNELKLARGGSTAWASAVAVLRD